MRFACVLCVLFAACGLDLKEVALAPTPSADAGKASALAFLSNATKDGVGTHETIQAKTQIYATLREEVREGATTLPIALVDVGKGFEKDDLVLVHRSAVGGAAPSGLLELRAGNNGNVGRYVVLVVKSASDRDLEVSTWDGKGVPFVLPLEGTQVVRVGQFTEVVINNNEVVRPVPWNGTSGGILAFVSKGGIQNNGMIEATGCGSRGGWADLASSATEQCTPQDGSPGTGYAPRGEGPFSQSYLPPNVPNGSTGITPVSLAGGGGRCTASGGGGGGHSGVGGSGGKTLVKMDVTLTGAEGGQKATYPAIEEDFASGFMLFGGGGGSGEFTNPGTESNDGRGGNGGGIIFIRSGGKVEGSGSLTSDGAPGTLARGDGGGGGGGAGGTIDIWIAGQLTMTVSAIGGNGGNADEDRGPGGGGGGGRLFLRCDGGGVSPKVAGGRGGTTNGDRGQRSGEPAIPELNTNAGLK